MEDYFFSTVEENTQEKKAYVLIIYDIVDNAKIFTGLWLSCTKVSF